MVNPPAYYFEHTLNDLKKEEEKEYTELIPVDVMEVLQKHQILNTVT